MPYSISDFNDGQTWRVLYEKVAPGLEEAARREFEAICGGAEVGACDIKEIRVQAELLKKFLCSYVDGLAELHGTHGAKFYGDASARKELHAKIRSGMIKRKTKRTKGRPGRFLCL